MQKIKHLLLMILLLGLAGYWLVQHVQWQLLSSYFATLKISLLIWASLAIFINLFLNTRLFMIFLTNRFYLPYRRMLAHVARFSMLVNVVPYMGGQAILTYSLAKHEGITSDASVAMLALDQIIDGMGKVVLSLIMLVFLPIPHWLLYSLATLLSVVLLLFILLSIAAFWKPTGPWFKQLLINLKCLHQPRWLLLSISISVVMRSLECIAIYLCLQAVGINLSFGAAYLVMAAIWVGGALPLTPAKLGIYEASVIFALTQFGIENNLAMLAGLSIHLVSSVPYILAGLLAHICLMGTKLKPLDLK